MCVTGLLNVYDEINIIIIDYTILCEGILLTKSREMW